MTETIKTDLAIIGAGSAGLSVAAGAVQMGARVVLIEQARMGGDCLNVGCVPSKSLLAAAQLAHAMRHASELGLPGHDPVVEMSDVRRHVRGVINAIAPNDSVERFEKLGVRVLKEHAAFTGHDRLLAGAHEIRAKRFVIATGSRPATPPIEGLEGLSYLTNETIFDLDTLPAHLIVIGGGPIGCELTQAFKRLGSKVTLVEQRTILPKDDPQAVEVVRTALREDGVELFENAAIERVSGTSQAIRLEGRTSTGSALTLEGSHLLVAAGRRANVENMGLGGSRR